jgi:acyl-CoA hydrolase
MRPVKLGEGRRVADELERGDLVAVADGVGMPSSAVLEELSDAADQVGDVHLLLGWWIGPRPGLRLDAFGSVRTVMGGYQLRGPVRDGLVEYLPVRLGTMPRLLAGPLRPDLLVASMVPGESGLAFGTGVGWAAAASHVARTVLVEENGVSPCASAIAEIARSDVRVVGASDEPPDALARPTVDSTSRRIAEQVAGLVREGSAVQVGPGAIGQAFLDALEVPVEVDSGVVTDGVMDLDRRGLLIGTPTAAYLAGSPELYAWAHGRPILRGVEETHDISRLERRPLMAVNTALEIDLVGQVNVEVVGGDAVAGIGGHADYALAASRSAGLSVIALPTERGGRPTLVERLSAPTSTARSDVDVVVTELGTVDLRGLSDRQRSDEILAAWDGRCG